MVGGKLNNKIISNRCQIFSQLLKASSQIYDYKCKSHTCNQCARCILTLESSIMAYPLLKFGRGAKSKFLKGMWSLKHSGPICLDMQAAIASLSFFEGQCLKGRASVGRVFGMVLKPYPNPPPLHTHTHTSFTAFLLLQSCSVYQQKGEGHLPFCIWHLQVLDPSNPYFSQLLQWYS